MRKVYHVITYINYLLAIYLVKRMVLKDGTEQLDYLLQKSLRCEHHLKNYEESLKTGLIPNGLRIKKYAAITPTTEDFHLKWQQILYDAEKNLVELLLYEASQVVSKTQIDLDAEIRKINTKNYGQKYMDTKQKYCKYRKNLEVKRSKKWKNAREKLGNNSKHNASSNASNVDKDNMLLNVSHNNHSYCCDLRQNLKDSPASFLRTNKISKTNVRSNNIQNKNTEKERARNEMTVVKVNETFITDNRTARRKKQKT